MMETPRTIPELLDAADSSDIVMAGCACRELLNRHAECHGDIPRLVELLQHRFAPVRDLAYRTIERIGDPAVGHLLTSFSESSGDLRRLLMGLISAVGRIDELIPLLASEIHNGQGENRIWAANCLGRKFDTDSEWPTEALELLDEAVELLFSLREQPDYWPQARMTLKHLGKIPRDSQ